MLWGVGVQEGRPGPAGGVEARGRPAPESGGGGGAGGRDRAGPGGPTRALRAAPPPPSPPAGDWAVPLVLRPRRRTADWRGRLLPRVRSSGPRSFLWRRSKERGGRLLSRRAVPGAKLQMWGAGPGLVPGWGLRSRLSGPDEDGDA